MNRLEPRKQSTIARFLGSLGPGVITGAADDDPAGIGTYTMAGAQFGTTFLWAALLTWPLMAVVQMACARVGLVTGEGLASAIERKIPRWSLIAICLAGSSDFLVPRAGVIPASRSRTG